MSAAKIGVITLFLLMAIGGIWGVNLAGDTFLFRAGDGSTLNPQNTG